jgi:uncharacterized protein
MGKRGLITGFAVGAVILLSAVGDASEKSPVFDVHMHAMPPAFGNDRILFGSDQMVWPQMITPAVAAIRDAKFLSEADKRRILWENAAALFGLR